MTPLIPQTPASTKSKMELPSGPALAESPQLTEEETASDGSRPCGRQTQDDTGRAKSEDVMDHHTRRQPSRRQRDRTRDFLKILLKETAVARNGTLSRSLPTSSCFLYFLFRVPYKGQEDGQGLSRCGQHHCVYKAGAGTVAPCRFASHTVFCPPPAFHPPER